MAVIFLNGEYIDAERARISPFDRGMLFGHAAYEVTAVYNRQLVDIEAHTVRLAKTLAALQIPNPYSDLEWVEIHRELVARNDLPEGLIYLQVSAGDYGFRDFAGPETFTPTVILFCTQRRLISEIARSGMKAITIDDTRWARRDLKTTQLVSQALAYRAARAAGAITAIMIEDGCVTEAASATVFVVDQDGTLRTRTLSEAVLPSITRHRLLALLKDTGGAFEEGVYEKSVLDQAVEVFTVSTGALIAPVIEIDGKPVGTGKPGVVTRRMQALYYGHLGADLDQLDWLAV